MKLNGLQALRKPDPASPSLPYQIFTYRKEVTAGLRKPMSQQFTRTFQAIHLHLYGATSGVCFITH